MTEKNVILVIGSVTAKQYASERHRLISTGVKPRVVRIAEREDAILGIIEYSVKSGLVLNRHLTAQRDKLGEGLFLRSLNDIWLTCQVDAQPDEIATIIFGMNKGEDHEARTSFLEDVTQFVMENVTETWGSSGAIRILVLRWDGLHPWGR